MLELVKRLTRARDARFMERVQSLWSGYGEIVRVALGGPDAVAPSVIVKCVTPPPSPEQHPRGWNTWTSHRRKLESYAVEARFYADYAERCPSSARVARCHGLHEGDAGERVFVLEDLDGSGFDGRRDVLTSLELEACLHWLANFHATFLGVEPAGLWSVGTYWNLATRPDELAALDDARLREAAAVIDARLNEARFRTLVHGDAKVANFCFSEGVDRGVAAVDFQYVGGGCGIKDVAYFIGSCMTSEECTQYAASVLDGYFFQLTDALATLRPDVDAGAIEAEWRGLYDDAVADFVRFLRGWAPGGQHRKLNDYADRVTERVLERLG